MTPRNAEGPLLVTATPQTDTPPALYQPRPDRSTLDDAPDLIPMPSRSGRVVAKVQSRGNWSGVLALPDMAASYGRRIKGAPGPFDAGGELQLQPVEALRPYVRVGEDMEDVLSDLGHLVRSVVRRGILAPLVVTADGLVLCCRRLHEAVRRARLELAPCAVLPIDSASPLFATIVEDLWQQGAIR